MVHETINVRAKKLRKATESVEERQSEFRNRGLHSTVRYNGKKIIEAKAILREVNNDGQFVSVPCPLLSRLTADSEPKIPELSEKLRENGYW